MRQFLRTAVVIQGALVAVALMVTPLQDLSANEKENVEAQADPEYVVLDEANAEAGYFGAHSGRVVRRGKIQWSTPLTGRLGGHGALVWDAERVYLKQDDNVTALDALTGEELWRSRGMSDLLLVSGDLLLAIDEEAPDAWLLARSASDGSTVYKTKIPSFPYQLAEIAGLFRVQGFWTYHGGAVLVDRAGKIRHRLNKPVFAGVRHGTDSVLVTETAVVRRSAADKTVWEIPFSVDWGDWGIDGGSQTLPGGDVLAYRYCCDADDDVELLRINPDSGQVVWRAFCASLGVKEIESEYYNDVNVKVEGERICVSSDATGGSFVETLDLRSGQKLDRISPAPAKK